MRHTNDNNWIGLNGGKGGNASSAGRQSYQQKMYAWKENLIGYVVQEYAAQETIKVFGNFSLADSPGSPQSFKNVYKKEHAQTAW